MKSNDSQLILLTGIVGMIGALLMVISDVILLARPISGCEALVSGARENTIYLAQWRLPVGSILGVVVLPLQIIGFWQILYALKPAGKWWSWPPFLIVAHMLIVGAAFHGTYAFVGTALKAHYSLVQAGEAGLPQMASLLHQYSDILFHISGAELVLASLWFVGAILFRKTSYPRWISVSNPLVCTSGLYLSAMLIPAPVGGYIAPIMFNLGIFTFLILSTIVLYRQASRARRKDQARISSY